MIERSWADIIVAVGAYSKVGQATFRECSPTRFEAGVLYVASSGPGIQSRVERFATALASAVKDTLGIDCRVALDDGPQGGPSGPTGTSPDGPGSGASNQRASGPADQQTYGSSDSGRDPNGSEDWPSDDAWQRAADDARSGHQSSASPGGEREGERPSSAARQGTPMSDGPRGGESAWQQHGAPREDAAQEPQWSDDSSGESFSGWQVAPIPGDDQDPEQDRDEQGAPHECEDGHTSTDPARDRAPSDAPTSASSGSSSDSKGAEPSGPHSNAAPSNEAPSNQASSSVVPQLERSIDEAVNSHGHLRVVPADGPSGDSAAPAPDEEASRAAELGGDTRPVAAESQGQDAASADGESASHPGRAPEREASEPAHDWSVAARSVGAPGRPVKGRECGWRYSGPESEDRATEHPSKWGQRTPHLTEVGGDSEGPAEDAQSNAAPRRTDKAERHLHAVTSDDAQDHAAQDQAAQGQPAQDQASPSQATESQTPPAENPRTDGPKPSFRERHAATIAASSTQSQEHQMARGRYGDVPVDPNAPEPPEDDWEDFEPSAQDEDVEDSAVFGQAAIETILGGRVLEERPHHRG